MLPIISGGHSAYQDTFVSDFIAIYPDPFALSKSTWKAINGSGIWIYPLLTLC